MSPAPFGSGVFWGVTEGLVAAMLIILAGDLGLVALQQVITGVGLPVFCLVFMMIPSIIMGFKIENIDSVTVGKRPHLKEFQ
jgi:choline/glycine/proline betaine transport protein